MLNRSTLSIILLLFCFSCNKHPDNKEYFFMPSNGEDIETETIVYIDSVFVQRFILKAPYSHYTSLLDDSLTGEEIVSKEKDNPFLMIRLSVLDSLKEDIAISGVSMNLLRLNDVLPREELPAHGVFFGNLSEPYHPSAFVGKTFSEKDSLTIKGGKNSSTTFLIANYNLNGIEEKKFLLTTKMTIKYKNSYNIIDFSDTIIQRDR